MMMTYHTISTTDDNNRQIRHLHVCYPNTEMYPKKRRYQVKTVTASQTKTSILCECLTVLNYQMQRRIKKALKLENY